MLSEFPRRWNWMGIDPLRNIPGTSVAWTRLATFSCVAHAGTQIRHRIALVVDPSQREGRIFDLAPESGNRDRIREPFAQARQWLGERGAGFETLDGVEDLERFDLVVFHVRDRAVLDRCLHAGLGHRTVYLAWEPPVVAPLHAPEGLARLARWFGRILTWDASMIDGETFLELRYPHVLGPVEPSPLEFATRGLLANLSADKSSDHPRELYGARREVIAHFERHAPDFELWGPGWSGAEHPSWRGLARSKRGVYHRFRFALCFENMRDTPGYLTEKLFDCLLWGVVPVYWGDPRIAGILSPEAFVDYPKLGSPEALREHLLSWTPERHEGALELGRRFLESEAARAWSGETFGRQILTCLDLARERPRRPSPGMGDRLAMRAAWWRRRARRVRP